VNGHFYFFDKANLNYQGYQIQAETAKGVGAINIGDNSYNLAIVDKGNLISMSTTAPISTLEGRSTNEWLGQYPILEENMIQNIDGLEKCIMAMLVNSSG
jgi:hypothetical protein